eukprot:5530341-Prymnesium_polylepis.2
MSIRTAERRALPRAHTQKTAKLQDRGPRTRASGTHLPRRRPHIRNLVEANPHKQEAALDASAEQAAHLDHAVARTKPPKHQAFVRDVGPAVGHSDAEKG